MEKELEPFIIQLAGHKIRILPRYEWIREYCKDYIIPDMGKECLSDETAGVTIPDLTVQISTDDIAYERLRSDRDAKKNGQEPVMYTDAYLETLAVYRKIAEWMPSQDIILFHGSVIAVDGQAYLFTAKSGTGKSTHTRLWREYFGERAVMVNDDKPLIKITRDGVYAYGTPWDGKHRLSSNIHAPLNAICILRRGEENAIHRITAGQAYPMLLQQCYRPMEKETLLKTMQLLDRLKEHVPCYELFCNISEEAVKVAYDGMKR
ncbi:MAG: hypothetical protein J6A03_02795 [Lachnospiraceae bacterium]|nr:hypothetical protein [Lachnospiraceae bacterium]